MRTTPTPQWLSSPRDNQMASQRLGNWGSWQQTRNSLVLSLSLNIEFRNASAPGSAEAALTGLIEATLRDMQTHAMNGLRIVDPGIAEAGIVARIKTESGAVKAEADRIRNGTRSAEKLSKLTQRLSALVGLFTTL